MNITTMTFVAPNLACGKARGGSISRSGSVTDEQRSHRPNSAQPSGRQFFFDQTSLLAPHRPLKGMLAARASSGRKIPRRERHRSYAHDHLATRPPTRHPTAEKLQPVKSIQSRGQGKLASRRMDKLESPQAKLGATKHQPFRRHN